MMNVLTCIAGPTALLSLLLAAQAQAAPAVPRLAEAKQATRCGALLTSPAMKALNTDPARKVVLEMLPGLLFARSKALGGSRETQAAWIAELEKEMAALRATPEQRHTQWRLEISRCEPLMRDEIAQFRKKTGP